MTTIAGEEWRHMDQGVRTAAPGADAVVAQAKANIPRLRQRDVTLRLVDHRGQPLARAEVRIVQTRHAFAFGDQTWALDRHHRFGGWDRDPARYWRRLFEDVFNAATCLCYWTERPRNDGPKTEEYQGEPRLEGFAACVDWARSRGMTAKGHPLFWSIPKCIPDWVQRYDTDTLKRFAEVRVRSLVARHRGRVTVWDAVNEPLWEAAPANLSRRVWPHVESADAMADYIAPVLGWCYEEDPDATFLVNDYGLEADHVGARLVDAAGQPVTAARQRRRMLELVAALRERGAAPSAIGMQAHTGGWIDPATQWAVYDELAQAGLPLHVTEFWADAKVLRHAGVPESEIAQRQADYVRDYLTVAFGHPAIDAFYFWGFMSDAIDWLEHSAYELKPMYHAVRSLLRETWHTDVSLTTDADGVARFRGFLGDYVLRHRGRGVTFTLGAQQAEPAFVLRM